MKEVEEKKEESTDVKDYRKNYTKQPSPFEKGGWINHVLFNWLNPMIEVATKTDFLQDMHYDLRPQDKARSYCGELEKHWKEIYPTGQLKYGSATPIRGLLLAMWRTYNSPFIWCLFGHTVVIVAEFYCTYLIYLSIDEVGKIDYSRPLAESQQHISAVWINMGLFILLKISASSIYSYLSFVLSLVGMKLRNALNALIFKKLMSKSLERDTTFDMGEMTNLSQTDAASFAELGFDGSFIVGIPIKVIFGIIALFWMMGSAMAYASLILVLMAGINAFCSWLYEIYKSSYMKFSDLRGKLTNEVFKNIRFIKMCGLENYYLLKLFKVRENEVYYIRRQMYRYLTVNLNNTVGPTLFMAVLYACKLKITGTLVLSEAFAAGMILGIFQGSFRAISWYTTFILDCYVSGRRIAFFLLSEQVDTSYIKADPQSTKPSNLAQRDDKQGITIKNGNFYWIDKKAKEWYIEEKNRIGGTKKEAKDDKKTKSVEDDGKMIELKLIDNAHADGSDSEPLKSNQPYELVLKDINLSIPKGACVAVIGKVGSGKSSLLSALIGELYHEQNSQVIMSGTTSYVSQKPWITSTSVKDIILFGKQLDQKRFDDCVKFAAITDDLKTLSQGIDTLLGDRGVNLSGGQKTRLAIARAFYADTDIYLFDDPISALDVHVGKTVMEDGILSFLKGKTRIIATHALAYLPYFDFVIIMDKGKIVERGTYAEIEQSKIFQDIKKSIEEEPESPSSPRKDSKEDRKESLTRKMSLEEVIEKSSIRSLTKEKSKQETDKPEVAGGEKTVTEQVIDHIISTEDKVKGEVITWELFKQYFNYSGGVFTYVMIFLSKFRINHRQCSGSSSRVSSSVLLAILDYQVSKFERCGNLC